MGESASVCSARLKLTVKRSSRSTQGVKSVSHGKFDPQGYIGAGSDMAEGDCRDGVFDAIAVGGYGGRT